MSVGKSTSLPKSAIAPPSVNAGPFRKNWDGPHRAIGTISKRASLCISSGGLCNTISRGSGTLQHLRQECCGRTVSLNLPSEDPERDLGIKSIYTCVYHPQTDRLVERFNRTLKTMTRKLVHEDTKNWDKWLEPLLFALPEVLQASTGFSPFELLYGHQPRGVLDVL